MSKLSLYANPYDSSKPGFYFSSPEEYEKKYKAQYKKTRTEEYEIDFIDGNPLEQAVFDGMRVSQANIDDYFDTVEKLSDGGEDHLVAFLWLTGDQDYAPEKAAKVLEDVQVFDGSPGDYAEELISDVGMGSDVEEQYFDWDKFGRDLSLSGDITRPLEEDAETAEADGDDEEAERLRDEIERLEGLTDAELAMDYVESIGSLEDALGKKVVDYFDYDAFARDMELNGDIATIRHDGTDYVITNARDF